MTDPRIAATALAAEEGNGSARPRPVDLELLDVSKSFGRVQAVTGGSLVVHRGETLALLGPSGCGKTTLLNIIAGFEYPDTGEVRLRGRPITTVAPNHRDIGLVLQHYALFPHLTVRRNIDYGLRARRLPAATIAERVGEVVGLLKLDGLDDRYPAQLSGGQRQRVAVARALAIRPVVLLLDEALSALDKNLREQMQVELSLLLRRLEITTVLVTHDQREAFAMGDRIAVMEAGRIVQTGTPAEVYARPRTRFVLEFLGSTNCLAAEARATADGWLEVWTGQGLRLRQRAGSVAAGRARLYVRAEDVRLSPAPTPVHDASPGRVGLVTFLGAVRRYVVLLGGEQVIAEVPVHAGGDEVSVDDLVYLDFDPERSYLVAGE